jgi:hypothetical protein
MNTPTFDDLWRLLYDHGSSNYYKHDCCQIWQSLTPEQQRQLYDTLSRRIEKGLFVNYNPLYAIHDNLPRRAKVNKQTLTYSEYYSLYRTTEPKDGWQMEKDANGKVIYTKSQQP